MGCPDSKGHSGAGGYPGITCKQLCEFLYDFVEGELRADRREEQGRRPLGDDGEEHQSGSRADAAPSGSTRRAGPAGLQPACR